MIDPFGLFWDGADVINAAVYAMEGNAVQAGISLACALPFIGNVVAGVSKGTKFAKMGNLIGKTLRTAGKMYMTTAAATTALDLAGDAKLEEAANGGKPSVSSMVKKAGALFLGAVAAANGGSLTDEVQGLTKAMDTVMNTSNRINADAMSGKCGKGDGIGCFIEGTKVKTAEGDRNIDEVEVGDYVLAENVETGEQEYKQVTETFTYEKTKLVHVYVGDEEIETTVEHPFYVEGLGFVSAGELQAGDIIRTSDGRKLPIKKVEIEELEGTVTVYNFEVEDFHTYYVSELGVLVHNECPKTNFYVGPEGTAAPSLKDYDKHTKRFNKWLNRGSSNHAVYFGMKGTEPVYTGITKQKLIDRLRQHNNPTKEQIKRGIISKDFSSLRARFKDLTRNQARAIEQYYIENGPNEMNKINSISPRSKYYHDALNWAEQYVKSDK